MERVTKLDLFRLRNELLHELVVDLCVDEDTGASTAGLAVVPAIAEAHIVSFNAQKIQSKW